MATGLVLDDGPAAAIALYHGTNSNSGNRLYYKSLAIYSLAGTYNSDWPDISGVASILINEDTATAGLTPRPRKIFDAATFVVPGSGSLLDAGSAGSADFNLGTADYTLEGTFRFRSLPTGTDYATLFGQWTESTNQRGYRLRLCGPAKHRRHAFKQRQSQRDARTLQKAAT